MSESTPNEPVNATCPSPPLPVSDLLAEKRTGTRISASGLLRRMSNGSSCQGLRWGCGELLRHLEELAERFYAGDVKAVDEFLQLYSLDDSRPNEDLSAQTEPGSAHED